MIESYHRPVAERMLDCFPSGVYALNTLLRLLDIVETEEVPTAAVECRLQPRLLVNPLWVARWAETSEKLLMLVLHELHHVLLGHTRLFPRLGPIDNLVFDAVINALLCHMFPAPEYTALFTDFYRDDQFPACLLRPPAGWKRGDLVRHPPALRDPLLAPLRPVYRALYSEKGASYLDLYESLRQLLQSLPLPDVELLGDHEEEGGAASSAGNLEGRSSVLSDIVRQIVERWPQPERPIPGRSLAELLRNESLRPRRVPSNRGILRRLLRKLAGQEGEAGWQRHWREEDAAIVTPLPGFDRRSVVLRALGQPPLLYVHRLPWRQRIPCGERVHVYLDVSGSIGNLKDALYGAVLDCRELVHPTVHLFSTRVVDVSLEELRQGRCETTGGTSSQCVARHMAEQRVRRAVMLTDGFVGTPQGSDRETFLSVRLGVALTPGVSQREDLAGVVDCWEQLH